MDENAPEYEEESKDLIQNTIVTVIGAFRIIAIVGAMVFVAAGVVLAFEFFYFVKDIVQKPSGVVQEWQAVMQRPVETTEAPSGGGDAPTPTETVSPDVSEESTPPMVHTPPETALEDGAVAQAAPDDGSILPIDATESAAEAQPSPDRPRDRRPAAEGATRSDPWLELADRLLEHTETGRLGWFAGMCFLVAFCWILGKIPAVILSTGTKVLVDLFKIGSN